MAASDTSSASSWADGLLPEVILESVKDLFIMEECLKITAQLKYVY